MWPSSDSSFLDYSGSDEGFGFFQPSAGDWENYAEGYRSAAFHLMDQLASEGGRTLGAAIRYPIVYLFRHSIEVYLKSIHREAAQLLDNLSNPDTVHDLTKLWTELRPLVEEIWPDGDRKDLDNVGRLIAEISILDPASYSFRYPTAKNGTPSHHGDPYINFSNFRKAAKELSNFFDGISLGVSVYLDWKSERSSVY